jgi:hypothetical protein
MHHKVPLALLSAVAAGALSLTGCQPAQPKDAAVTVFTENFGSLPQNVSWQDGSRHGSWLADYNGYGTTKVVGSTAATLEETPKASTRSAETHAGLVVTAATYGNVDITARQRTVAQLRTPRPNAWEVPWLLWNYTDDDHFYYIALKPNGWELGKEDPSYPGAQRYLATGSNVKFPVGPWHTVRARQVGSTISVWGDGHLLTTFTDPERPYGNGRVGLYTEDARADHDDVTIGIPSS